MSQPNYPMKPAARPRRITALTMKLKRFAIPVALLLASCGTTPDGAEMTREVVLQYVGGDAGTAGPFSKKGLKELETLAEKYRAEAVALFDRGAVAFVIYTPDHSTRVVFVQRGKVVGDFRAASPATRT